MIRGFSVTHLEGQEIIRPSSLALDLATEGVRFSQVGWFQGHFQTVYCAVEDFLKTGYITSVAFNMTQHPPVSSLSANPLVDIEYFYLTTVL